MSTRLRPRFHRGHDGWGRDSYRIPSGAVLGASDCGAWPDAPCRTDDVVEELERFRKVLREAGIRRRWAFTQVASFATKRWLVVPAEQWGRGIAPADQFLREHDHELQYVHDARS